MSPGTRRCRQVAVALAVLGSALAACTSSDDAAPSATTNRPEAVRAGLGPMAAALEPSMAPTQAGPSLDGTRLPTSQWWTSALTGPWTQPMWAMPIVAQAAESGLGLAAPTAVRATADAVTADPTPQLRVGGPLTGVSVVGYGDFSVDLQLERTAGAPLTAMVAQGSAIVHLSVPAGTLQLEVPGGTAAVANDGSLRTTSADGRAWQAIAVGRVTWAVRGDRVTATVPAATSLVLAPRPTDATDGYDAALRAAVRAPTTTQAVLSVDRNARTVRQELSWATDGPGLVATLPHQRSAGAGADLPVLGSFPTPRGRLDVVAASSLELEVPLQEPPTRVPALQLDAATTASLRDDLAADLDRSTSEAGIYDDAKALGRLAILADIADRLGAGPEFDDAVARLTAGLVDWLTYNGPQDARWLAYEPTWGGIVANPPQFGSQDYNDHHFHFAYLIRAAASLQRLTGQDPALTPAQADVVDLLVADVLGGGAEQEGAFPSFRVWNAYQGHSAASGFVPFAAGGNQESSSEALQAWEAIADWGRVTDRRDLVDAADARYSLEALTARTYWLGEVGDRPDGYDHAVAGIVWDGKIDFATFFDSRPEAVIGIQLLPFTPGSTYRSDAEAAAGRVVAARQAGGGEARLWPDLFVMDEAVADPAAALDHVDDVTTFEKGNSRTWLRWWVLAHQTDAPLSPG